MPHNPEVYHKIEYELQKKKTVFWGVRRYWGGVFKSILKALRAIKILIWRRK